MDGWWVELAGHVPLRVVWDGKDAWLIIQTKAASSSAGAEDWSDIVVEKHRSKHTPEWVIEAVLARK